MELNKIYHIDFMNNTLPDKSVQFIIADPPYFEVKGEFDFIWSSFDDYLADVEKWAQECKRLLADNGTLYWWGSAKKIAYSQIIMDKHFNLLNNITWENTNPHKQQIAFSNGLRSFAPLSERLLVYSNSYEPKEYELTGLQYVHDNNENFRSIKKYLDRELDKSGMSVKDINSLWGNTRASHCFGYTKRDKVQFQFLSENQYLKLQMATNYFRKPYNELRQEYEQQRQEYEQQRQEYEQQRQEYEDLRRPFNNFMNLGDVIRMPNFDTSKHDHDTVKPEKLTRALILTSSRKGDTVLAPFAGSGTECAMAAKEGRNFIGFDVNEKYVKMAQDRCDKILAQPSLF